MTNKLNNNSLKLLLWNTVSLWARTVFKIFINILIWKETNDIKIVALFNIYFISWHWIAYYYFSSFVKIGHRKIIYLISFIGFILNYLFIIYLWADIINYIFIIWFFFWISNWMYYITYNVNQFDLTTFNNRWNFEWLKKWLKVIWKTIFPTFFWVIIWFYDINIALLIGILLFIISYFIWNVNFNYSTWKTHYNSFFKIVLSNKKILLSLIWIFIFTFAFSIQLLELMIPILIYNEVWTEIKLWFSLSFLSILSVLIIYAFWKLINYKYYNKSLLILVILYIISLLGLLFANNYNTLLIFASFNSWILWIYWVILSVITINSIHSVKNYSTYRVEFLVFKEILTMSWWILSFLIVYISGDLSNTSLKIIFYTMIVFSLVTTYILSKINIHRIK